MGKVAIRTNKDKRKLRVKKRVFGTSSRPRISVYRSNKYIYAQLVDDEKRVVVATTFDKARELHDGANKTEAAFKIGELLASRAKEKKVSKVVFDRNGYKYHGRVKSLAEGARKGGLDF